MTKQTLNPDQEETVRDKHDLQTDQSQKVRDTSGEYVIPFDPHNCRGMQESDGDEPFDPELLRTDHILPKTVAIVQAMGKDILEGVSPEEVEAQIMASRSTKKRRLLYTVHACELLGITRRAWWSFVSANNLEPATYVQGPGCRAALWPPAYFVGLVVPTRCPKCGRKKTTSRLEWDRKGCRCLDCRFIDLMILGA
jgi:hypothetical protein